MRILIVKLGRIGDIVHTLPSLAAIRRAMPNREISWVVEHRAAEIYETNPILDRLIEVDTEGLEAGLVSGETLRAPRQQLRTSRLSFELALDFGYLNPPQLRAFRRASCFWLLIRFAREPASRSSYQAIRISKNLHVIQKNLALAGGALRISVLRRQRHGVSIATSLLMRTKLATLNYKPRSYAS